MNRNVFNKLSKKKKRIIIALMIFIVLDLALLTITSLPFTRAFFQSNANSSVDLDTAKFSFLVNGKINEEVSIDLNSTLDDNYTKVIPGSSGVITLKLDASESEVNIRSVIKINRDNIPDNLKIYKDAEHTLEINNIVEIINYKEEKEVKLYWKWVFTNDNENNWMDKQISININVTGEQIINKEDEIPYEESTLAYNIIKNAMKALPDTESTIYSPTPKTVPAKEASNTDERTLSITEDDYGNSYYFRGNVQDNYLNFNNMCWRIVRIEGDGSIKLILEDKNSLCETATGGENAFIGSSSYGYIGNGTKESPYKIDYLNCTGNSHPYCLRGQLQKWFDEHFATSQESDYPNNNKSTLKNEFQDKIKYATWDLGNLEDYYTSNGDKVDEDYCLENGICYYEAFYRNTRSHKDKYSTIKSTEKNTRFKDYISTITIDEIHFAGLKYNASAEQVKSNYIYNFSEWWWTLSPATYSANSDKTSYGSSVSDVSPAKENYGGTNYLINIPTKYSYIRPMIVLNNITINNALGTKSNPYKVE